MSKYPLHPNGPLPNFVSIPRDEYEELKRASRENASLAHENETLKIMNAQLQGSLLDALAVKEHSATARPR